MSGFLDALRLRARAGFVPVIPDFKMVSPSDGPLFSGRNVIAAARELEKAGAPALSVVTEQTHFGGSLELLEQITKAVRIPVLRKDFIRSSGDMEETVRCGAKAVLLICACMTEQQLRTLYRAALDHGLMPLVEAHTEAELRLAGALGAELVGINNRDILALERDGGTVRTTARLAAAKPAGAFLISESGIEHAGHVRTALQSGADAVLVGTAIWKHPDPFTFYKGLSCAKDGCT